MSANIYWRPARQGRRDVPTSSPSLLCAFLVNKPSGPGYLTREDLDYLRGGENAGGLEGLSVLIGAVEKYGEVEIEVEI